MDPKILDDLARKLTDSVPPGLRGVQDDIEKNFHTVLQSAFNKLNLVTREEFEVQAALLARTREKLDRMEAVVTELEAQNKVS